MKENSNKPQIIYILPNLFTAASAFVGIISIISAANGHYGKAVLYIILSLLLDGLDGRVARLTHTTSKFGLEFDSLADIIAFGVAPAMLFYFTYGHNFGKFGSLVAGMFVVFGAIRLARFNVTTGTYEPSVFIGLPIPTAAVVSSVWIAFYLEYPFMQGYEWLLIFVIAGLALLMVSNIRYPSFKKIDYQKANFLKVLVWLLLIFFILYLYTLEFAFAITTGYVLYGIIRAIYNIYKVKISKNI